MKKEYFQKDSSQAMNYQGSFQLIILIQIALIAFSFNSADFPDSLYVVKL